MSRRYSAKRSEQDRAEMAAAMAEAERAHDAGEGHSWIWCPACWAESHRDEFAATDSPVTTSEE